MAESRTVEDMQATLRACGLRATSARVAVLGCLEAAEGPLSHAEVFDRVRPGGFDRATVYRNLVDLTEVGLARRYDLGDHVWRFELAEEADAHAAEAHAHFVCNACGSIECLPDDSVAVKAVRGAPRALAHKDLEVQVRGTCDECVG